MYYVDKAQLRLNIDQCTWNLHISQKKVKQYVMDTQTWFVHFFFCTELANVILLYTNKRQIWNSASAWPNQWYSNFVHCLLIPLIRIKECFNLQHYMIIATPSGSIKGVGGGFPQSEALPPLTPVKGKKAKISYFWRIFFIIFAPQNRILPPRCPPQKKKKKKIWCRHWWINRIPNVFLVVVL